MQLVKLGGSVLTDKSSYKTPRLDVLARLAIELGASGERLVVVHGAGSYGHILAKEHRVAEGKAPAAAVAQVHRDVRELTGLVLQALGENGLAPIHLSAYDLARMTAGELANFSHEPIVETLANRFTPVMSGDVVLDAARGTGILSGDVLMVELARVLRPQRAIFVTDVDGIYDRDPHESGARLHASVDLRASADIRETESRVPDITGSMAGKLRRAGDVARAGVAVHIVNGMAAGRLADVLAGKDVVGTIVTA